MNENINVIRINKACPEEYLDKIALLEQQNFSAPWTKDMLRRAFASRDKIFIAALYRGELTGYIGAQLIVDELDIFNVAVDDTFRRRGIGELLVRALKSAAAELNAYRITLEVRAGNTPAISLYEKQDFVQVGRRKNYYQNPREDAILMDCII